MSDRLLWRIRLLPALAALLLLSAIPACREPRRPEGSPEPTAVFPGGWSVRLTLAVTPEAQEQGLMFVDALPDDRGMLFVYSEDAVRPFWMKNCKISLDLVWLLEDGTVAEISAKVPPCPGEPCPTVQASVPTRYTLEVRGGLCEARGLKAGDKIRLSNIGP